MSFFSKFSGNKKDRKTPAPKAGARTSSAAAGVPVDDGAHTHEHEHTTDVQVTPKVTADVSAVATAIGVGATKYIIKPLVTEQGTLLAEHNTYLFQVALHANKRAIREAIEKIYGVQVVGVHTARYVGKRVRYGRVQGQRSHFKKAFVTVAKGQTIVVNKNV